MARIRWTNHPSDKSLNGQEAHVSHSTADVLCALQQAAISPYRGYVDFLSSCHREGSDPSNVNPPQVVGVVWECSAVARSGTPTIFRKQGGEVARITDEAQAIQHGCPESVLNQFRALVAEKSGGINVAEAAKQEQAQRDAVEKTNTWKTVFRRA